MTINNGSVQGWWLAGLAKAHRVRQHCHDFLLSGTHSCHSSKALNQFIFHLFLFLVRGPEVCSEYISFLSLLIFVLLTYY